MVSGTLSLLCKRCFSPFPHGTCSLSVSGECLALADGPAGFTQGSTCPALLRVPSGFGKLRVRASHPLRTGFPDGSARFPLAFATALQPRWRRNASGLGCAPFARRYWGYHVLFSLPPGTKMFQFPGFASTIGLWMTVLQTAGLPHSDIGGSKAACASPPLFAACHVFHRLPEPRHPPCALSYSYSC